MFLLQFKSKNGCKSYQLKKAHSLMTQNNIAYCSLQESGRRQSAVCSPPTAVGSKPLLELAAGNKLQEINCTEPNRRQQFRNTFLSHWSYTILPLCKLTTRCPLEFEIIQITTTWRIPSDSVVHPIVPLSWISSHLALPAIHLVTP